MRNLPRQLLLVFLAWTAIALIDGLSRWGLRVLCGTPTGLEVFRQPLGEQWIWAALTPVVFWTAGRVPLRRPHLARAVAVHTAMFVLLTTVHGALAQWLEPPWTRPAGYAGPMLLLRVLGGVYSDLWMYWPLVGLHALLSAHARQREQERQAARLRELSADLRLSLLRAQIQPHFLFNTLHAISALLKSDPRAADDLVSDLAEILRASFADGATPETTLGRELELVACYLRIQRHRFGDRLQVDWQVDETARAVRVPALALQSLVENAVVHGLAPSPRGGTLTLVARREGDALRLVVRDDGVGLAPGHREGVGLSNTRERLARLHGEAARFLLDGAPGRGTTVELLLPWATAPGADDDADDHPHPDRGRRAAGPAQPVVAA